MTRITFLLSLVASIAAHVWLITRPPPRPAPTVPPIVIPVVETELAAPPQQVAQATPAPEPPVERAAEPPPPPEPEPEPAAEPPRSRPDPEPPPAPQPPLEKVADVPRTKVEEPGDYAGRHDEEAQPAAAELFINWGTVDEALAALSAGDMVIVVLRDGQIIEEVSPGDDRRWQRRAWIPRGATKYSNRLRVVDQVPAFGPVVSDAGLHAGERLAVLLPMRVERVLESAKLAAAFEHGVSMQQVEAFAGRFALRGGRLEFDITHVGSNAGSATP